nr:xanthan lyase [uncultured bacterium]
MGKLLTTATIVLTLIGLQPALAANYDVVIYGGTSAGVIAAVQAKKMGRTAVIVGPDVHLGGLTSGGLGWTDSGNKAVIGGVARDFYHRVWQYYQNDDAWRWQPRSEYGNQGQGSPAIDGEQRTMWIFEPHVAERVYDEMVKEYEIPVHRNEWLDRETGVTKTDSRITSIKMLSGLTVNGRMFIDASYEGDLMATAGVAYHVGRESSKQYDEKWAGVQTGVLHHRHHFGAVDKRISPYVEPGNAQSGLLARISPDPPGDYGAADKRIQAYCFRMCLTNDNRNRIPFPKPTGYDVSQYELLLRILKAGWREGFQKFDPIPNHKTDTNNHGPFSTDNIGFNYDYPEGSYDRRRQIIDEHRVYQQGLMYFLANDPRVPQDVREKFSKWGLAADEFKDNGNWPHQIYVREARRMIGEYVMTENELLKRRPTPQSIGMGSYAMDSHNVQRYVKPDGFVQNEGDIGVSTRGPYEIAFGSILPKKALCQNLVVPVCVSSSHIAFGSIRMEPVFMILGQSAATTAAIALEKDVAVQDVKYDDLRARLLKDGQILEYQSPIGKNNIPIKSLTGTVVDDSTAELKGDWTSSTSLPSVGREYLHDRRVGDGRSIATFTAKLATGRYEVRLAYSHHSNRATNVPVTIQHAEGTKSFVVNQRHAPPIQKLFVSLGTYSFGENKPAVVKLSNEQTDGYVIADAVQFLPVN